MKTTFCFLILLFALCVSSLCVGQADSGFPSFGTYSSVGGGIDSIDLSNLNVHLSVPLRSLGAGGMSAGNSFEMDSSGAIQLSSLDPVPVPTLQFSYGAHVVILQGPHCGGHNQTTLIMTGVQDSHGTFHMFPTQVYGDCGNTVSGVTVDGWTGTAVLTSNSESYSATDHNGVVSKPAGSFSGDYTATDPHGNVVSSTLNQIGSIVDAAGATVLSDSALPITDLQYKDASNNTQHITIGYTSYLSDAYYGCPGETDIYPNGVSLSLITSITFADSSKYTFTYENGGPHPTLKTGRIATVNLPTGATITYNYSGYGTNGENCSTFQTAGFTKTNSVDGGIWKFDNTAAVKTSPNHVVKVTTPSSDTITYTFDSLYQTQKVVQNAAGSTLETVTTCYNGVFSNCVGNTRFNSGSLPPVQKDVYTDIGAVAGPSASEAAYDAKGRLTSTQAYDFGKAAVLPSPPGVNYAQKTTLTYDTCGTTIINRPCVVKTVNTGGSTISQVTNTYNTAGDLTQAVTKVGGSSADLTSSATYNGNGTILTTTDVNNNITNYTQSDCAGFFPSTISTLSGVISKTLVWDCVGEVITSVVDPNGNPTGYTYSDPFYRADSTTDSLSNTTNFSYTPTSVTSALNFASSTNTFLTTNDGMGRSVALQAKQSPSGSNYDTISSTFDSLGRPSTMSIPCSTTAGKTCPSAEGTQTYDALSRPLLFTDAGAGTSTIQYVGRDVLITAGPAPANENVKSRQFEYDAFARLLSVCEVTSVSGSGSCGQDNPQSGFVTSYAYDASPNLHSFVVTQGSQTRTFVYDDLGRLISETNPENGQTTYTYDSSTTGCSITSAGDLVKRVDAVGNTACFSYDGLHRNTRISYSGPYGPVTPTKTFVYDSATVNGQVMQNTKGHVAEAYTGSRATDLGFSYSVRGELTDVYESTPHSGGFYHVQTGFWPNGSLASLSGAGIPTVSYGASSGTGLDGEGRVQDVDDNTGFDLVQGVTYNTRSQVTVETLGSGDAATFNYDTMGRMTNYQENINGTIVKGQPTYNANGTINKLTITDPFNSFDAQTCKYLYDDLVRLSSAKCGTVWGQTFAYDQTGGNNTGNISKAVVSGSGGTNFQATYYGNNQLSSIGSFVPVYDANGNLKTDSFHTYTWNADNQPVTVDALSLTYDAFGHEVEMLNGSTDTEYVYFGSSKLAVMDGQTQLRAFVPLPGGLQAVMSEGP